MTTLDMFANQDVRRKLPKGWRWVRLGDVCELNPRRAVLNRDDNTLTTFVPMTAVDDRSGTITTSEARAFAEIKKGYTYFEEGDVLFAKITPCMQNGKHAIANNLVGDIGFGSTEFHVIRPGEFITAEWVHHYIRQPRVLRAAMAHFTGAVGQQRVPSDYLIDLEIPLPPLPEQRRIAAILAEQFAAIERARAAATERLAAAQALPAAYLRAVFESAEARGWPRKKLGTMTNLLSARSISTNGDTDVLAITTACLTESGFNPTGVKRARMWASDAQDSRVSPGEILIARSNTAELVGRVALYEGDPKEVVASDLTIRIWPGSEHFPAFLTAYLSYLYLTGYWREKAGGASDSMKKITRSQLVEESLPVPPMKLQTQIVDALAERMTAARSATKALQSQLAAIDKLPAALLRRAFNGEV